MTEDEAHDVEVRKPIKLFETGFKISYVFDSLPKQISLPSISCSSRYCRLCIFNVSVLSLKTFFKENETPSAERVIKQCLESIELNCKWFARDGVEITRWLTENN